MRWSTSFHDNHPSAEIPNFLIVLQVDTELVYAYAITKENGPLEEFISGSHQANLQNVGDRCYEEGLYEAAKIIFQHIPNWGKLASTLVKMHLFQQAVDAARKANSPRTWKEVKTAFQESGQKWRKRYPALSVHLWKTLITNWQTSFQMAIHKR